MLKCGHVHHGDEAFALNDAGILIPRLSVEHRDDEYDSAGFDMLNQMQLRHFWYRGRHRFLLHALKRALRKANLDRKSELSAIDLGGGCGGWINYLAAHDPDRFTEVALADSSAKALQMAGATVGENVGRYQIDLLRLPWTDRWDVAFLLDVLEHIPEDTEALRQIRKSLRPGGHLLVTTPALNFFHTYNDDLAHHVRRYSRRDFARLARETGFELCWSRYFMFFLSPLLLLSRFRAPDFANMSDEQILAHQRRTHRVPAAPINATLGLVFASETPLGSWLPFPWGTSILGVFQKRK